MAKKEVIISGAHMELTEALKGIVNDKVERLFRHEETIIRVRVELGVSHRKGADEFTAKGHIEINGPDLHVSETTEDLYKSIDQMVDKLDRMLRQRSRQVRTKRKHPHEIELPAEIPKTQQN